VIGADTIVAVNGRIVGKADGPDEARQMLAELSSVRHAVITGVALVGPGANRLIASDTTYVTMRPMRDEEIEEYIQSGEWIDKAGAYAIQETADRFVQRVDGSLSNVVGLPMELLSRMIAQVERTHANRVK
jgi:septum formation protein